MSKKITPTTQQSQCAAKKGFQIFGFLAGWSGMNRCFVQRALRILIAILFFSSEHAGSGAMTSQLNKTAGHERMLTLLEQIARRTSETNVYTGVGMVRRLREQLANLPANTPPLVWWHFYMEIAEGELRLGNEVEAIAQLKEAYQLLPKLRGHLSPLKANSTLFRLGVAHMRQGETQNCCLHHIPESCILPLQTSAMHTQEDGSRRAIAYFSEVLRNTTAQTPLHLEAQWLINIAHMTIGGYPAEVPKQYLLPPETFQSEERIQRFENIAPSLGLATFDMSGGAIADDFDNDGYLDLLVSTWDVLGQIRFFRNNQDGTFAERTIQAGLMGLYGGLNLLQADYDNDGDVDILVLRGAWLEQNGRYPNSLLRNNGNSTFTDVTFDAGLGQVHYPSQTASWGDYDNDGDLDLYVGNETTDALKAPCQLFRNNADGTFTDLAADAGVQNYGFTKAVIWGDYNGDRWPDLYVSNFKGANRLYRNNGNGTFTDVAEELNVTGPIRSFPAWFWDFDNDGILDLYVSAYSAGISDLAAHALGLSVRLPVGEQSLGSRVGTREIGQEAAPIITTAFFGESNREVESTHLYTGDGRGGFKEVARKNNLRNPSAPMGSNFGDLDNDGYPDFYLGTGYPDYKNIMPNVMYLNNSGNGFFDVTYSGGFGHLQKGHSVVFADFDNDGDQDIFEQMGGAFPGDRYGNALFENPGFGNHWIAVELVGVDSNTSAIGARIRIEISEGGVRRSIYKHVNSGGSFGANPLRQTIGVGKAEKIETLEVFWPTTGLTQSFHDVLSDAFIQVVEGEAQYAILDIKKLKLSVRVGTRLSQSGAPHLSPIKAAFVKEKNRENQFDRDAHHDWKSGESGPLEDSRLEVGKREGGEFSPEFADAYNRGLDLLKRENYMGAVEAFKESIDLAPEYEKTHYILGRIYLLNLAKTDLAIAAFLTTIKLVPNHARAHQMLGVAYSRQSAIQKGVGPLLRAIELGAEVVEDYPYHPYYDLGMIYAKQHMFDDAIRYLEQAIELHPDQIRAHYSLGNAYIRRGDIKKGAEHIRKYQTLKPYLNTVSQLENALRRMPANSERWHQLGRLHTRYGRFDKAINPLRRSIELDADNWKVYNLLAVCYMRLNQLPDMERVCEVSVRIAPNEVNTHNALGMSYFLQGKNRKALEAFKRAVQLDVENPESVENLGKVYERLGEKNKAVQALKAAQQLRARQGQQQE